MKKLITILGGILFTVTIGCGEKDASNKDFITVDVTAKYPKKELILQDFLDVEYIPLETTDEFLTSANIQAIGKKVMIFRNMRRDGDLFIFDRTGKGLRKINRSGQGGEEYANILGVVLDEDNDEMFINSHFSNKIFVYDLLGNFKRSFNQRERAFYDLMGNFDRDHLICHDGYFEFDNGTVKYEKRNYFLIISKQDGSITEEIPIPYEENKSTILLGTGANGRITDRSMYNREQIAYQNSWILTEPSADTIYISSPEEHMMKPLIVRTPSIQAMDPEMFLFPGVFTDRYYFMQIVKKEYDFVADTGFPRTELVYDRQEKIIFECTVHNDDFSSKKPMSLVWEYPMFAFGYNDIAFIRRLEAHELIEAYEKGELKGRLKEIASNLDTEANAVIMLAKHKK